MREISAQTIIDAVKELFIDANRNLPEDVRTALTNSAESEPYPPAKSILDILCQNADIACSTCMPICQDTGMAVLFCEIGQDVHVAGNFEDAVNEGVKQAYVDGLLRKSVVEDPLRRVNTGDNTPAIIHVRLVEGSNIKLTAAPKGFGSENMSRLAMLPPSKGIQGVKDFVVETVRKAGANPCPPMVLGIGIGGDFERVAELAKEALLAPLGEHNSDPYYADLELELLDAVNSTGIGPQGMGGKTTCLGLHVQAEPTHIASLPVAVNVSCHVTRHKTVVL